MFDAFRKRMEFQGGNIRQANRTQSQNIMSNSFNDSQSYRQVIMNGQTYDARIISDSKTTVRGGNGNFVIQFKDDIPIQAGSYVQVPNAQDNLETWLILYESDATLFPKHIIKKCNYLLKWKNSIGKIVERWVVFSDNRYLMDGEKKTYYNKITIPYTSTSLILPCDEETINIRADKRFLIDHEKVEEAPDAWVVTNRNVISKRFDAFDGVVELAIARHQYNHNTDNRDLMIADYYKDISVIEDVDNTALFDCRIVYNGTSDLKMGTPFKNYTAEVYRDGELAIDIPVTWDIIAGDEVLDNITSEFDGNLLKIKCKFDRTLINSHMRLVATNEEYGFSAELPVKVVSSL